uniref:Uncharacterized protein n=1 Tax=Myoviridae sp. cte0t5 TaxID=2823549 RepID=A0A8S5LHE1_9CAUD|nr:MAG TPA: hypothetical protein [Myoviridae sp. cte0t5]
MSARTPWPPVRTRARYTIPTASQHLTAPERTSHDSPLPPPPPPPPRRSRTPRALDPAPRTVGHRPRRPVPRPPAGLRPRGRRPASPPVLTSPAPRAPARPSPDGPPSPGRVPRA